MRSLLVLCLALSLSGIVRAEPVAAAGSVEVGIQLVDAMGLKAAVEREFQASISNIMSQLKQMKDETLMKTITDMTTKFYDDNYKWEKIGVVYATAYAKEMTDEEMKMAITFYNTPAGKKLTERNHIIQSEATKATKELLQVKTLAFQRSLIGAVQTRQMEKSNGK